MSISLPKPRSLAAVIAISLVAGGLALAPASVAVAATTAQNQSTVFTKINSERAAVEAPALSSSVALSKIAQKYAAASAAKGKKVAAPTSITVDANPEALSPVFSFSVAQISSKSKASAAYAKLDAATVTGAAYDFGGVGYATKGSKTFVVALVADYVSSPLETITGSKPILSGTPSVGNILIAKTKFTPADVSLSYNWTVDGEPMGSGWGSILPLFPELKGKTIAVEVTASKNSHKTITLKSASKRIATGTFAIGLDVYGDRNVGQVLYVEPYPSGISFSSPTITYQWYRGSTKLAGQTNSSYEQVAADLGKKVWVRVKFVGAGFTTATKDTSRSIVTKKKQITTSGISVSTPDEQIVVGSVLTVDAGDWLAEDFTLLAPGVALKKQWLVNGVAVKGATADTFTVPASAVAQHVSVRVTGTLKNRDTTVRTSSSFFVYGGQEFEESPYIAISGTFAAGKTVKAKMVNFPAGATVKYRWFSPFSGKTLNGGTKNTFTVSTTVYKLHYIGVEATVSRPGYRTITTTNYISDLPLG